MIKELVIFSGLAASDLLERKTKAEKPEVHLQAAQSWLRRAHDMSPDGGVSYGYSIRGGWKPSYRETSGYIATTFFNLARHYGDCDWHDRALRICRWLLSVQNTDGSFSNPNYGEGGIVFDTGQDLFGLVRAYEETGDEAFRQGALQAAGWLVKVADGEGRWTRYEHLDTPHVYNSRTAWALLRMNQVEYDAERERIARVNLDWAVSQQRETGFFENCSFVAGNAPFTHNIAYTARGLFESGLLLGDERYIKSASRCADAAIGLLDADGFLPGQITPDGHRAAGYCCLTGNCQFAIVWSKLFEREGEGGYRDAAVRALNYVMARQHIRTGNVDVRGAIKGSHPIWGRYSPLTFPNWPTKFFIDAMLFRTRRFDAHLYKAPYLAKMVSTESNTSIMLQCATTYLTVATRRSSPWFRF